jgi:broad specificity phosphatase PhoE
MQHDEPAPHRCQPLGWPHRLMLVRHAQSVGNLAADRAHEEGASRLDLDARDADVELSETGREQAEAFGGWLAELPDDERPTLALASPYARAAETARIALATSGLGLELRLDERLRERDLGILDGLTGKGYAELYADEAARRKRTGKLYYRAPGGESWSDVALRVRSLLSTMREEYADERVLVVSHQAVVMSFRLVLEGLDERTLLDIDSSSPLANCSVTRYDLDPSTRRLALVAFGEETPVRGDAPVTQEPDATEGRVDEPA